MSLKLSLVRVIYRVKGLFEDPLELFRECGVKENEKILEVGCAIGYHTLPLAELASSGKVYAVDVWEEGVEYLRRKAGVRNNIEILLTSAEKVNLDESSIDKVVCFDTLHEISDQKGAVGVWVRVLKRGGIVLYRDPVISAKVVEDISDGNLNYVGSVKGVDVLKLRES